MALDIGSNSNVRNSLCRSPGQPLLVGTAIESCHMPVDSSPCHLNKAGVSYIGKLGLPSIFVGISWRTVDIFHETLYLWGGGGGGQRQKQSGIPKGCQPMADQV